MAQAARLRRAEPDSFTVEVGAEKLRDEKGRNYLADITPALPSRRASS